MIDFNNLNEIEKFLLTLKHSDLIALIGVNGSIKRFTYGNEAHSIFKGRNGNLLIRNFSNGKTIPFSKFLINIGIAKDYKSLKELINSYNFTHIERKIEVKQDKNELIKRLKNSFIEYDLDSSFFENKLISRLQLNPLLTEYKPLINQFLYFININILLKKNRLNISDFSKFRISKISRVDGIGRDILMGLNLELIISNHLENREFNCRFKSNRSGWRTVKGARNSGFFFKNKSNKKSILYIAEGAKDGINTYLTSGYDVFVIDSKSSLPTELIELINSNEYKQYRILNDRDDISVFDTYKNKIDSFKNVHFLDWNKILIEFPNIPKNGDISDILSEIFKSGKTLRDVKREINKFVKNNLTSLESIAKIERIKKYQKLFNFYESEKKIKQIKELLKSVYFDYLKDNTNLDLKALYAEISQFLIRHRNKFKFSKKIAINKYLSEKKEIVLEHITDNKISLINSTTGSGKSHLIRLLAIKYRLLIIVPLKGLAPEFETEHIGLLEKRNNDIELEADMVGFKTKNMSFVMTTERFIIDNFLIMDLINSDYFNYIIFDEQQLINQGFNFRPALVKTHYILREITTNIRIKTNIVYLSGTPTNFDDTNYALLEVSRIQKTKIDFEITNESLNTVINKKLESIDINENIMIYCSTTEAVKEVMRFLRAGLKQIEETINDVEIIDKNVSVVAITSRESFFYIGDKKIALLDDRSNITKNKKTIYITTSKTITGMNIKPNHLIQYGTLYTPENIIQFHNRLRDDGTITVIPIKTNLRIEKKRDKTIGLINAFSKFAKEFKVNSIKDLIDKNGDFRNELKRVSDLKEISINSIHKSFKEELVSLGFYNLLKIDTHLIDGVWIVKDILILNSDVGIMREHYNNIELNKEVDYILSEYANLDILTFNSLYNTSQIFNVISTIALTVKKYKTIENIEEIKAKREENKSFKELEIDKYFREYSFNDYEQEFITKLFKDVSVANIIKFVNMCIENKKDLIRNKFELIRTSKDMKIFISFRLGFVKEFKDLLKNELQFREFVTVKELLEIYTQKGYRLSARGTFKSEIQYLAEDIKLLTADRWSYIKKSYINKKHIRNFIKQNFTKEEKKLIQFLHKNQVTNIKNFINFSDKNLSQLQKHLKEEKRAFDRDIEEYLNKFDN